jgi:Exopolysaccharide biosynthesis protein YbjH
VRAEAWPAVHKQGSRPLPRYLRLALLPSMLMALALAGPASADDAIALPRDNFGDVGMIDMPSARMAPDGALAAGVSFFQDTRHFNLGFEATPWLEVSFRYSGLTDFDPQFPIYYDRSFAAKVRFWDESDDFPAVALGINDLVGTGVYGGEYLVASKSFGDFDASLGIGWGRLGSTALFRNPFTLISKSFENRSSLNGAGQADFGDFFHGAKSGLFGGLVWRTPIEKLSLIVEYSSDTYALESLRGGFHPRNQINYGASYEVLDGITLGLNWLYGQSVGGNISFQLDPVHPQFPDKLDPAPPPVEPRSAEAQQQALQNLLGKSDGQKSVARLQTAERNAFVDGLMRTNDDLQDIRTEGRTLALGLRRPVTPQRCQDIARVARSFGNGALDTVTLTDSTRRTVRCTVFQPVADNYQTLAFVDQDMPPLLTVADLGTIDASVSPQAARAAALNGIRADAGHQNIGIEALALVRGEATVYYSNNHYFSEIDALDRLTRVLMNDAPPDIEKFRLVSVAGGVPQKQFEILRAPQERLLTQDGKIDVLAGSSIVDAPPLANPVLDAMTGKTYPRFSWDLFPQFRQELFDPVNPFAVQFLAAAEATLQLLPGLSLQGEVEASVYDNFNKNRPSDSVLPHVRSDFLKYFVQGRTGIGELELDYRFRLAPDVFAIAKAGYLESMFAGVGGEILWRPSGQRWALGVDLYDVKQRDYDRLLGLRDYNVATGHVSIYYSSPWYDLNFAVSAGRYLAGDQGLTFQVTRRFATGVEIGAFATATNVSASQFGEGSFDKGIIIRIPLGWVAPIETQGRLGLDLRPTQRDGGQRLANDATLFDETRRTSEAELLLQNAP